MNFSQQKFDGSLLAARYAFMPNKLRYCGGDKNTELFEYTARQQSDAGLHGLLKEFETMYPYLRLIAEANKIFDPFNYKVVEAYWIGNELLENVSMQNFYRYLVDEQKLKKKFKLNLVEKVIGKIPAGAKPHHSFHVFNIPKRTGHYPAAHTLKTMDECRIGWGKVKNSKFQNPKSKQISKSKIQAVAKNLEIEYQPLVIEDNKLKLGEPINKEVWSEINDKAFTEKPKAGDWVSLHWSWVCDFLTEQQVKNLQHWTQYNLALANLSL